MPTSHAGCILPLAHNTTKSVLIDDTTVGDVKRTTPMRKTNLPLNRSEIVPFVWAYPSAQCLLLIMKSRICARRVAGRILTPILLK